MPTRNEPGAMTDDMKQAPRYRNFPRPDEERLVFPLVQNLNDHELVPQMAKFRKEARSLWSVWEDRREARQAELSRILKHRNKDNVVLVMTLNQGFSDLLLNWIKSCDLNGIEVRSWTLIVALDTETAASFEAEGFAVYCDANSYGAQRGLAVGEYGDHAFIRMMFPKTAVVQDLLELGYDVLFQDVDIIWKKDPSEILLRADRKHLDAQFMYDGPNAYYAPLHVNSGFFFLRNTRHSREFWNMVYQNYDKMFYLGGQQRVVNTVLVGRFFRGLQLDVLPENDFTNGHLFHIENMDSLPADPYVVHVSWTSNLAHKMKKYHMAGLWYI